MKKTLNKKKIKKVIAAAKEVVAKEATKKEYEILSVELECWGGEGFEHPNNTGGFILNWVCKGIGFGQLTFVHDKKLGLICETECMSRAFVDAVMKHFLDKSVKFVDR